jgi:hypothetical protein
MLLLLVVMFGLFVNSLIFAPVKTPLIIVSATEFSPAVAPNAWVREDVERLKSLDDKTFTVLDTSPAWHSKRLALEEFERQWSAATARHANDGSVILYVSLPGMVDDHGTPALLLPESSPWDSGSWLMLAELLDRLKPPEGTTLQRIVLLDCTRFADDWNLGVVQNTFVERVGELIAKRADRNLHVITSGGPREKSWASPELHGSAFGQAVAEALAGESDKAQKPQKIGNRNGRVSLFELHRYTAMRVGNWARDNRGVAQTPQLFSGAGPDGADFRLAWSLDRFALDRFRDDGPTTRAADTVSVEALGKLWRRLDALRDAAPYQVDPLCWRDLEHGLLRLEKLAQAGAAYREPALKLEQYLTARLERAATRAASRKPEPGGPTQSILSDDTTPLAPGLRLHSSALAQKLGVLNAVTRTSLAERFEQAVPSGGKVASEDLHKVGLYGPTEESQFIQLLRRYQVVERQRSAEPAQAGLALHAQAEVAAIDGDPRAGYWLQPTLAAADAERRRAFDRLLAENKPPADLWAAAQTAVARAGSGPGGVRGAVEQAIAARDSAAAEAPYLAQWLCRFGDRPADDGKPQDIVARRLVPWLAQLERLGTAIDDRKTTPPEGPPDFVAEAAAMREEWTSLRKSYLAAVDTALKIPEPTPQTLADLQAALELPLLPAERRQAAMQKIAELAQRFHAAERDEERTGAAKESAATKDESPSDDAKPVVAAHDRDLLLRPHPLALLLGVDKTPGQDKAAGDAQARLAAYDEMQAAFRGQLFALPKLPSLVDEVGDEPLREQYARSERRLRLAAGLAFAKPAVDPARRLRLFDLQELVLRQCRRRLDDFWGAAGAETVDGSDRPRPFFDIVVTDHLQAAEALLPPRGATRDAFEDIERLLAQRRMGAMRGARIEIEPGLAETGSMQVVVDVVVRPGLEQMEPTVMPAGTGFAIALSGAEALPIGTATFAMPPDAKTPKARLAGEVPETFGSSYQALAVFRGNEYSLPFMRPGLGGVVIDVDRRPIDTAQVTLFGDRPQQSSVMFVLDCSSSMATEMPVELVNAQQMSRLDVSKGALDAMLEQLAARADTRVGVRFLGHRVGWAKGERSQLMTQTDYSGPIPDDLSPAADVELVLPLGRFDSVEAGLVSSRLKSVKPWGQSPLYLALTDSIRDFAADKPDTDKSVVVITDGANYQFTPAGGGLSPPAHQTLNDVLSAWQGKNVPIYILGFGTADDAAAEREFTTLAEQTGGRFFRINDGRDLLRTLRDRLGLGSYEVDTAGNAGAADRMTKLNTGVTLSGLASAPRDYTVRFQSTSAEVEVEGGEALELYASPDGTLRARSYDRDLPVEDVMSLDGDPKRYTVRVHRPRASGKIVRFPVSLQENDAIYTRRPLETWIEITPIVAGRAEARPRYLYYDRKFEPGTPVPVVMCMATDWPAESKQAQVRVWFKYEETKPQQTIDLAEVVRDPVSYAGGTPVRDQSDVKLRIQLPIEGDDSGELRVIEEHGAGSQGVHVIKVDVAGTAVDRVVRRFDAARGLVVHTFQFGKPVREIAGSARLTITSRSAALQGALHVDGDRALKVDLGGNGDFLPLDAATGAR